MWKGKVAVGSGRIEDGLKSGKWEYKEREKWQCKDKIVDGEWKWKVGSEGKQGMWKLGSESGKLDVEVESGKWE